MKSLVPNIRLIISSILVLGLIYFLFPEVQAAGIPYPAPGGIPGASLSSGGTPQGAVVAFAVLLQRIADGAAALAASVAILFMVLNGARLTFAFGNSEALGKARKGLMWAAAGLVLIIFAYIVTKTVIALTYSGSDGSAVIGTDNLAPTTTTPGEIDPINGNIEVGDDGVSYLSSGQRTLSFYQQGAERTFKIYVPTGLDASKVHPVVMIFHGGNGNADSAAQLSGLSTVANTEKFIAVYPEAGDRQWNDGRATTASAIDDVAYVNTLINQLLSDWKADPTKVFAAGISNGGMMTQRLACEGGSAFAGFGSVAANLPEGLENNCAASGGVNLVMFGGTEDPIMPYDGGEITDIPALGVGAGGFVLSYPDTTEFWAARNQCGTGILTDIPDSTNDNTTIEKITYDTCALGSLEGYKITGGGHNWPGSTGASALTGNVSRDVRATNEIIDFFKRNGLSPAL